MIQLVLLQPDIGPPGGVPVGVKVIGITVLVVIGILFLFGRGGRKG